MNEHKSKWINEQKKTFVISQRFPALRDAFIEKGWEDGEDEMLEDEI